MSATDHLGTQFNDLYEMGHGHTGMVPTHALHDLLSSEYLVEAKDIPHAFVNDPPPHHTPESMDALTEDVRMNGIQKPLKVYRSVGRYDDSIHHELADGSHRYLAALRTGAEKVPVNMYVHPS